MNIIVDNSLSWNEITGTPSRFGQPFESFFGVRRCGGPCGALSDISRFSKRKIVMLVVDDWLRGNVARGGRRANEQHPYFVFRAVCKDFGVLVGQMVTDRLLFVSFINEI
jgi:hypothetical protein